ncbi:MAG: hypothetical protein Q7T86_15685 [Hyphomicrobiaceae bacterium]|nr:hypothetical protein [Hyphomicrobiaceae bacterium]
MAESVSLNTAAKPSSYVEWAPIIAGAVLASAISFVLLTAGAAIGLSMVSVHADKSYGSTAAYAGAFWAIAVPIGSLLAGGYIAGRMRTAWAGPGTDEVQFRDGTHGALVWALSVIVGAMLAASALSTAGHVAGAAASAAGGAAEIAAPAVDGLVRSQTVDPKRPAVTAEQKSEAGRILLASVRNGSLSEGDKTYLGQTVAQVTGVPPEEAQKRVNDAYNAAVTAVEDTRRATAAGGLITATALLLGLAAAWFAAQRGGAHRDESRPASFTYRRPV